MYERFTDHARKVLQLANQEAHRFNHEYVGTEHILLGLVRQGDTVVANVLNRLGVGLRKVRLEIEKLVQCGPDMVTMGKLPQTPRAKKVIEYAISEARDLSDKELSPVHLLLGLLREQEGVAALVLTNLGATLDAVRREVMICLNRSESDISIVRTDQVRPDPDLPEVKYFNAEIKRLNEAKEAAVAEQEFEKAANLRDQVEKLSTLKEQFVSNWWEKVGPIPRLPGVQELDTAIDQVLQEKKSAIARCDETIEKLNAEKQRIIWEWCKQQANKNHPPKPAGRE
jgi:ATP-dependent Clp protease ATP-binding subunit ClpA